jgi:hypothetical protein
LEKHGSLTITLGGLKIAFQPDIVGMHFQPEPFIKVCICNGPAEVEFKVHPTGFPKLSLNKPRYKASNWALFHERDNSVIQAYFLNSNRHLITWTATLDPGGLTGDLYHDEPVLLTQRPTDINIPPHILDVVLLMFLLADRRGLMMHACGLNTNKNPGLLFSGVSGAGKSTTAQIWKQAAGATILGDERVVLREQNDHFWMYSTPWTADNQFGVPRSVPLGQIFIIRHGTMNQARQLKQSEAVSNLLARSFYPAWDERGMDFTLDFLDKLCKHVPVYELGFVPDASVVEYVKCLTGF